MGVFPELIELAQKYGRTLLRTERKTVDATSEMIDYLNKSWLRRSPGTAYS